MNIRHTANLFDLHGVNTAATRRSTPGVGHPRRGRFQQQLLWMSLVHPGLILISCGGLLEVEHGALEPEGVQWLGHVLFGGPKGIQGQQRPRGGGRSLVRTNVPCIFIRSKIEGASSIGFVSAAVDWQER